MMRSLSSGVAGLRTHQTKMDVIGNNIANVNTYGFKSSRVTFADVYYQTISGGTSPTGGANVRGGVNATQIGYGSQVATIDMMTGPTGAATTNRALDVYLTGEGFITSKMGDEIFYTRLGNLSFDSAGNLVDHSGNIIQGFDVQAFGSSRDAEVPNLYFDRNYQRMWDALFGQNLETGLQDVLDKIPDPNSPDFYARDAAGGLIIPTSRDEGLYANAISAWKSSLNGWMRDLSTAFNDMNKTNPIFTEDATGQAYLRDIRAAVEALQAQVQAMRDLPLAAFTGTLVSTTTITNAFNDFDIAAVAVAGLAGIDGAGGPPDTLEDDLDAAKAAFMAFAPSFTNEAAARSALRNLGNVISRIESQAIAAGGTLNDNEVQDLRDEFNLLNAAVNTFFTTPANMLDASVRASNGAIANLETVFNAMDLLSIVAMLPPDPALGQASQVRDENDPLRFELAQNVSLNELNPESALTSISLGVDVEVLSMLTNINIDQYGRITGLLSRDFYSEKYDMQFFANEVYTIGQLALVNFNNPDGLMQAGNSYYKIGMNSGEALYSVPGYNGTGQTQSGYLEMSNVDIAQEFTDMITTQRGFQANTRIITVSDEMLAELVNLKR